jgi:glyceraldehyde-3-phosphate dehydrogenase type I
MKKENYFNVAINGYGRIGRCLLRAIYENYKHNLLRVVAINDPTPTATMCYLTKYDSTHGVCTLNVSATENHLHINNNSISIFHEQDPKKLNWNGLKIDLLFDCSGSFKDLATAQAYLASGVNKLLISNPSCVDTDGTIIFGVNEQSINLQSKIISAGSCTANCIVPVITAINKNLGINSGSLTTLHSAMNDQPLIDSSNTKNLRLARSALQSMIPVDTALSLGIDRILPELAGKIQTNAIRVPTVNVSCIDACFVVNKKTSTEQLNEFLAVESSLNPDIIGITDEPHASIDFNHDKRSCIIDITQTKVSNGNLIKILCWFDNEWAFANKMLDISEYWLPMTSSNT